jgi:hypothetical protein
MAPRYCVQCLPHLRARTGRPPPSDVEEGQGIVPRIFFLLFVCVVVATACGGTPGASSSNGAGGTGGSNAGGNSSTCTVDPSWTALKLNELSSDNDGHAIDEVGRTDDFVELVNTGSRDLELSPFQLVVGGTSAQLPAVTLRAGERIAFWADGEQAPEHRSLPVRLSRKGEKISLRACGKTIDGLELPALSTNQVYARFPDGSGAFSRCQFASVGTSNGERCEPLPPPPLERGHVFAPYRWELPYPREPQPITIDELVLRRSGFVELRNSSASPTALAGYRLFLSPLRAGAALPTLGEGTEIPLPVDRTLEPEERLVAPVLATDVAAIALSQSFEGVASLFGPDGNPVERVDFAWVPEGASLARIPAYPGRHVFCSPATPNEDNADCQILAERKIGSYDRHLRTLADFDTLSAGSGELGLASVKFLVDLRSGDQVYFPSARDYSLHFEFVREVLEQQQPLDRCIPSDLRLFYQGWYDFSVSEYFKPTDRRFLLGTLTHHAATDLYTVEFALGDTILPADMQKAFFTAMTHVLEPQRYFLRPQDDDQTAKAIAIDGALPIVSTNTPFIDVKWQPLSAGVGFGTLTYVPAADLATAQLGPDVIVVTDDVPNDLPLVGGLVTEAFQTPLSHVNVLCQNRGTPNLALPAAHERSPIAEHLGKLVRFEVTSDSYRISPASPEEARSFWESRFGGEPLVPRLDLEPTEIANLENCSLADLPSIGAKAAQLAELVALSRSYVPNCTTASSFTVPTPAFAVPLSHFDAHFQRSGARAKLIELLDNDDALTNRDVRRLKLAEIREAIANTPVAAELLTRVTSLLESEFGSRPVRFRSSSNAEDLPNFNGAGLYTSTSADLDDPSKSVEAAIQEVWSSLYRERAFDERQLHHVDHMKVAMGVLIHPAFVEERANGVIITRDVRDIVRGDIFTFNAQAGEASVTNPAPGVSSDQFIYRLPPRTPPITDYSRSSLAAGSTVMTLSEVESAACAAQAVVNHFRPLLDPLQQNAYFTMDIEFKLLGNERTLLLKQARPYSFGSWEDPGDCRQL